MNDIKILRQSAEHERSLYDTATSFEDAAVAEKMFQFYETEKSDDRLFFGQAERPITDGEVTEYILGPI